MVTALTINNNKLLIHINNRKKYKAKLIIENIIENKGATLDDFNNFLICH